MGKYQCCCCLRSRSRTHNGEGGGVEDCYRRDFEIELIPSDCQRRSFWESFVWRLTKSLLNFLFEFCLLFDSSYRNCVADNKLFLILFQNCLANWNGEQDLWMERSKYFWNPICCFKQPALLITGQWTLNMKYFWFDLPHGHSWSQIIFNLRLK